MANVDKIVEKIKSILEFGKETYCHYKVEIRAVKNGFVIDYSKMYDAPPLGFDKLKALSEFFGTEKIDVDGYAHGGCETCDWGSSYGHVIEILNPTKNIVHCKLPMKIEEAL